MFTASPDLIVREAPRYAGLRAEKVPVPVSSRPGPGGGEEQQMDQLMAAGGLPIVIGLICPCCSDAFIPLSLHPPKKPSPFTQILNLLIQSCSPFLGSRLTQPRGSKTRQIPECDPVST